MDERLEHILPPAWGHPSRCFLRVPDVDFMGGSNAMTALPYVSPFLRRMFIERSAASIARRYDDQVVYWIQQGFDIASARDMADASVRYDFSPQDQIDCQGDFDQARENKDWMVRR